MRTFKAGDLRHPVTLLEPVTGMANNKRTVTWTEHPAKAGKRDVSAREFFQAQAYGAENTVTFTLRWRSDVKSTWRIRHGSITYDIMEVNHLGYMRDYIQLKCREMTGGGV
jgi:SPP1 family predicted phage head-tail adaptor